EAGITGGRATSASSTASSGRGGRGMGGLLPVIRATTQTPGGGRGRHDTFQHESLSAPAAGSPGALVDEHGGLDEAVGIAVVVGAAGCRQHAHVVSPEFAGL